MSFCERMARMWLLSESSPKLLLAQMLDLRRQFNEQQERADVLEAKLLRERELREGAERQAEHFLQQRIDLERQLTAIRGDNDPVS